MKKSARKFLFVAVALATALTSGPACPDASSGERQSAGTGVRPDSAAALAGALAGILLAAGVRTTLLADLLAFADREGDPSRGLGWRRETLVGFGLDLVAH